MEEGEEGRANCPEDEEKSDMYSKGISSWLKHFDFFLMDLICLEAAYFMALLLRYPGMAVPDQGLYFGVAGLIIFIHGFVVSFNQSYKGIKRRNAVRELKETMVHTTYIWVCMLIYLYMTREIDSYSRNVFFSAWGLSVLLCWMERTIWKKVLFGHPGLDNGNRRTIIITFEDTAAEVIERVKKNCQKDVSLAGVVLCGCKKLPQSIYGLPVIADEYTLADNVKGKWIDEALVVMKYETNY